MIRIFLETFVNIIVLRLPGPRDANRPLLIMVQKPEDGKAIADRA